MPSISKVVTPALIAVTIAAVSATAALAQPRTIEEIASYQGPDRMARLIEGAKKEGVVSVYGSSVAEDMKPVSDAFKSKYGIDFQYWRASSENLVQRTVAENRAGRCLVDGFATVAAELEALHREKLLQAVKTPLTAELIPQALRPHGEWVARLRRPRQSQSQTRRRKSHTAGARIAWPSIWASPIRNGKPCASPPSGASTSASAPERRCASAATD